MKLVPTVVLLCLGLVLACKDKPQAATVVLAPQDARTGPVETPGVVASAKVSMRASPEEKAKLGTAVGYGERLTVLEKGDAFCKVRLSDGAVGYIPTRHLIVGSAEDATLTADQDLYARPDSLSPIRRREKAGTLLFVLADKNGWRQVQSPDRTQAWIPRDKAVVEPDEVGAALALFRGEALVAERHPEQALGIYQAFLAAHAGARLAPLVEARLRIISPPDASAGPSTAGSGNALVAGMASSSAAAPALSQGAAEGKDGSAP